MNLLVEWFEELLSNAQKERPKRQAYVNREFAWVTYEREVMFDGVNSERAKLGYCPVTLAQLRVAENAATGHTDYVKKFALYCAELVLTT